MHLKTIESPPSVEEYIALRKQAGLSAKSMKAAEIGLPNSLYAVTVRDGEILVAMGRVIGDGGCFFEIVDIAVLPEYQGRGLGKKVMHHIENYLQKNAVEGSYVSMVADKPGFYKKLGYKSLPSTSEGMYKYYG